MRWWRSASFCATARSCWPAMCAPRAGQATPSATTIRSSRSTTRARSSTRSTSCISCRAASICRSRPCSGSSASTGSSPCRPRFRPERFAIPITVVDGLRAAIFICYEIIFPDEVGDGVKGADFIVNVTNDAWFGDTPGPYQHFRSAQIRAAATGLPLVQRRQQRHFGRHRFARAGHRCLRSQRARRNGRLARHSHTVAAAVRRSAPQRLLRLGATCAGRCRCSISSSG